MSVEPEIRFDAILGNPPYQRNISGSTDENRKRNASKSLPIYQHFVEDLQDKARGVSIVTPARWVAGGWGLEDFRQQMLSSSRIRELVIFNNSDTVFAGSSINGGVSVIHFSDEETNEPHIIQFDRKGELVEDGHRRLLEPGADFFVRDHKAVSILQKIGSFHLKKGERFSDMLNGALSGFNSNFSDFTEEPVNDDDLLVVLIKWREVWASRALSKDTQTHGYRVLFQLSHGEGDPRVVSRSFVYGPGVTYTHSFVGTDALPSLEVAESVHSYVNTRFFRYLANLLKITIVATSSVYRLIPIQMWDRMWTDAELFKMYSLTDDEIAHIESAIAPPRAVVKGSNSHAFQWTV